MAWKKTKITNNAGKIITAWKNEKGQISYTNPKAIGAAKKALQVSGVAKGLSGIRDTASFIRSSLKIDPGSRPGQFLGGPLPKKIEAKSKQLLIDEEKEKSLNPQNYKQWSETEGGKAFIQKEAAIQEGLDEDARYTFRPNLEKEKVTPIPEEPTNKGIKSDGSKSQASDTSDTSGTSGTSGNKSNRFSLNAGFSKRQIESQLRRYKFKKTKASDALKIKRLENLLAKKRSGG
jgi:hypothetical protein